MTSTTAIDKCYIYALRAVGTDDARYVGKTNNPARRLAEHWRSRFNKFAPSSFSLWLRSLAEPPQIVVLETVAARDAYVAERTWIKKLWTDGAPLTNVLHVPGALRRSHMTYHVIIELDPTVIDHYGSEFLTRPEAASFLSVGVDTVKRMERDGRLRRVRLTRSATRITTASVKALMVSGPRDAAMTPTAPIPTIPAHHDSTAPDS
jgi:excisionase family DNA binding protein